MRERQIEKALAKKIKEAGGLCMKFVSPGNSGVPDRIAVLPGGGVWFLEIKTDTGRASPVQIWQIERLKKAGANVRIICGMKGVEDFVKEVMPHEVHSTRLSGESDKPSN